MGVKVKSDFKSKQNYFFFENVGHGEKEKGDILGMHLMRYFFVVIVIVIRDIIECF